MSEKHIDSTEVCLYKYEMDEEAWERLLDKLNIHEPATAVCITVSHVKTFMKEVWGVDTTGWGESIYKHYDEGE